MAEIEMTLGWVIAYVDDPGAAAAFYERTFGLRTDFVVPDEYAQMDTGSTKLGFASYALARANFDGGVHCADQRISFAACSRESLATSVNQTSASIPQAARIARTRRRSSEGVS